LTFPASQNDASVLARVVKVIAAEAKVVGCDVRRSESAERLLARSGILAALYGTRAGIDACLRCSHCNSVEVQAIQQQSPPPNTTAGAGYHAACFTLAGRIDDARRMIAWLLAQADDMAPIPGTKRVARVEVNIAADRIKLTTEQVERLNHLSPAAGERHEEKYMARIDR
jgi:hypothetical protein